MYHPISRREDYSIGSDSFSNPIAHTLHIVNSMISERTVGILRQGCEVGVLFKATDHLDLNMMNLKFQGSSRNALAKKQQKVDIKPGFAGVRRRTCVVRAFSLSIAPRTLS